MSVVNKDYLLSRITAGFLRFRLQNNGVIQHLRLKSPTAEQKYLAEEYYEESLEDYHLQGLFTDEEYEKFIISKGIWSKHKNILLETYRKSLEDAKVDLFECKFKSLTRKKIKEDLTTLKEKYEKLIESRHSEIHKSAKGLAGIAKLRFIIGISLYDDNDTPLFNPLTFWSTIDSGLLDQVVSHYNQARISESDFRELARTEPWRSQWSCKKACGENIFGTSVKDLTDDQRSLIYWSLVYDNVFENPECPAEEVINDDDALDGFLISQYRKRSKSQDTQDAQLGLSEKMSQCDEIFIPCETWEDAQRINALNSEVAKARKEVREKTIKTKGVVNELELPDVNQRLRMEMANKGIQAIKESRK